MCSASRISYASRSVSARLLRQSAVIFALVSSHRAMRGGTITDPFAVTCLEATYESGVGSRGTFIGARPYGWWIDPPSIVIAGQPLRGAAEAAAAPRRRHRRPD